VRLLNYFINLSKRIVNYFALRLLKLKAIVNPFYDFTGNRKIRFFLMNFNFTNL